ncbi:MAG: L-histidine N(alpha)-methyltransferase [Saprospiraceae bacterium]|nr:L-histidine N(alpha)-methyltransferase [Saprospiraceae bacterium]MDZ4702885.1 L-histidine N(alpha)-methyltransferase [Saprospiraceae bacterium]
MIKIQAFAEDVQQGLTDNPKHLLSRYFYDAAGDRLFQKIMNLPEYYLTWCEFEIFQKHRDAIFRKLDDVPFDLIELGAGDGLKTQVLLQHFLNQKADFRYLPIDISGSVLEHLQETLKERWPELLVTAIEGEYFSALQDVDRLSDRRKLVLFLGSNIGNMNQEQAADFLRQLRQRMHSGDWLLVGFDLKKDPDIILAAYNDLQGVTRAFNLNLLHRINRELGADFDLTAFRHCPVYNPLTGDMKSYLVSEKQQTVRIEALELEIPFRKWEAIDMELSKKYDRPEITRLAEFAGFEVEQWFFDEKEYFVNVLFRTT